MHSWSAEIWRESYARNFTMTMAIWRRTQLTGVCDLQHKMAERQVRMVRAVVEVDRGRSDLRAQHLIWDGISEGNCAQKPSAAAPYAYILASGQFNHPTGRSHAMVDDL